MKEHFTNPLVVSLLSLAAGSILTILANALRNKTAPLGSVTSFNRIGVSTDDEIFGSVRVSWQGHELRNLYSYTIEIENPTLTDYDNVEIDVYSSNGTVLLNEKTEIVGTPYIAYWKPAFRDLLEVREGEQPSEQQFEIHRSRREYFLPVINRWQKLRFTYLCTRPNDDDEPGVFASTPNKGIRIVQRGSPYMLVRPIFGVPVNVALVRALVIAITTVIFCSVFVESIWIASSASMAVGLLGQLLGASLFSLEREVKRIIAG